MAIRPVYKVKNEAEFFVEVHNVDFQWHPGFAVVQKQKSIESLHSSFISLTGCKDILEISSKSKSELGVSLSAFNLGMTTKKSKIKVSVESAFQGSKKFTNAGPFQDLYFEPSKKAKKDVRLKTSGRLIGFQFFGVDWPIEPKTLFYDWIYLNALYRTKNLKQKVVEFSAFTDIEFNPEKSINCQAYSAALFVSLTRRGILEEALHSKINYMEIMGVKPIISKRPINNKQLALPGFEEFRVPGRP